MTEHLDASALIRMATDYLARYAAPTQRLRQVLERRVRRWYDKRSLPTPDEAGRLIDEVLKRLGDLGLVDDQAFAVSKARGLVQKGWPGGRIRAELGAAGLDPRLAELETVLVDDDPAQARRFAARKRLGAHRERDRASLRDRDVRRLMRAGFSYRVAAGVIDEDDQE